MRCTRADRSAGATAAEPRVYRLARVSFRITRHSRSGAPTDALPLLLQRLGRRRGDVRFTMAGKEIRASLGHEAPVSMERDEREEIGRLALLEIVQRVCEDAPELELAWFAISPRG
jgi:hypothetical protein